MDSPRHECLENSSMLRRKLPEKSNAAWGQPPQAASFVDSCSAFVTADAVQRSLQPNSTPKERRVSRSRLLTRHLAITNPQPLRWPAAFPAPKRRTGRRPQCPGNQSHCRAFLEVSPRQFSFENHRLPLALPQSSGKLRNSHVSLNPLLSSLSRRATQKPSSLVKKLWTMCLPCGRPRKTNEDLPG
jgi:hypothetical protein